MENITITINKKTADAILKIEDRYYFDLFEGIRDQVSDEYHFRNAIEEIANKIKRKLRKWVNYL